MTAIRWGKAGVRLTPEEAAHRNRLAVQQRNKDQLRREENDRIGRRLWAAGEVKPYLLTWALDAMNLFGPEVDRACGAAEPDVDLWEAGKLYPTWEQLQLLADLTGKTPRFFCHKDRPLQVAETSMRFHGYVEQQPLIWSYPPEVVAATVAKAAM